MRMRCSSFTTLGRSTCRQEGEQAGRQALAIVDWTENSGLVRLQKIKEAISTLEQQRWR
jgi:hypothetical protein